MSLPHWAAVFIFIALIVLNNLYVSVYSSRCSCKESKGAIRSEREKSWSRVSLEAAGLLTLAFTSNLHCGLFKELGLSKHIEKEFLSSQSSHNKMSQNGSLVVIY